MEKWLCLGAMIVAGLILFLYGLDLVAGIPFGHAGAKDMHWRGYTQDVLFVLGAALVLWQGWETWREVS